MELKMLKLNSIQTFPQQPRETFDKDKIKELADSIEAQGLIEPIVVRVIGKNMYQIIAGERRWRAYSLLKKNEIPAIIWDVKNDAEAPKKSLIENWERVDLTDIEKGKMVYQIWEDEQKTNPKYSVRELAKDLGKHTETIRDIIKAQADRMRFSDVPETSTMVLRETRGLEDDTRKKVIEKVEKGEIKKDTYSVRAAAQAIKKAPEPLQKAIVKDEVDFHDAKRFVEIGIPEDMEEDAVEELKIRKIERDRMEDMTKASDEAMLKKEIKGKIKVDRSADEKRLAKFEHIRDSVRYWRVLDIRMIKTPVMRDKAIEYVREISETATALLHQLQEMKMEELEEG